MHKHEKFSFFLGQIDRFFILYFIFHPTVNSALNFCLLTGGLWLMALSNSESEKWSWPRSVKSEQQQVANERKDIYYERPNDDPRSERIRVPTSYYDSNRRWEGKENFGMCWTFFCIFFFLRNFINPFQFSSRINSQCCYRDWILLHMSHTHAHFLMKIIFLICINTFLSNYSILFCSAQARAFRM